MWIYMPEGHKKAACRTYWLQPLLGTWISTTICLVTLKHQLQRNVVVVKGEHEAIHIRVWVPRVPRRWGSQISRRSAHEGGKVFSPTNLPLILPPPGGYSWYSFLLERLSWLQGHSAIGRFKSMKNSSGFIGNWTRDLSACIAAPENCLIL